MKKLIAILTLFVFSLFVVYPQSQVTYIDTLKSVSVSVSTDVNKKVVDPIQTTFTELLKNQTEAQIATKEYLDTLTSVLTSYVNEIEVRNKSDGEPVTTKFGYNTQSVKKILKTERWIDIFLLILGGIYLFYVNGQLSKRDYSDVIFVKTLLYISIGVISAFMLRWLIILLFNSGYFYIKELIGLYT